MNRKVNKYSPPLRFQGFADSPWGETSINHIASEPLLNGIFNDPTKSGRGYYLINVKDMYTESNIYDNDLQEIAISDVEQKYKVLNGDIFFTRSSLVASGIACSNMYAGNSKNITFDGHLIRLRVKKSICLPSFINFLLKTSFIRKQLIACGKTATMTTIGQNDINKTIIRIPNIAEQQKIADCLSSLDELIEAHEQKRDALVEHKKGLMQRLFPAEGETTPRWRFPEFRKEKKWDTNPLGTLATKIGSGVTPRGGEQNYLSSGVPFVRSQNVGWGKLLLNDIVFIPYEIHETFLSTELHLDDVLLNITGASIGRCALVDNEIAGGNVNQHVCIIRVKKEKLNSVFLMQYVISAMGQKQIDSYQAGGNRQGLNFAQVAAFDIPLPSLPEQQKIADCLSSLDARIEAEEAKIASLREHKQGLMQRLFPQSL